MAGLGGPPLGLGLNEGLGPAAEDGERLARKLNLLNGVPAGANEKSRCGTGTAVDLQVAQTFGMSSQAAKQERADTLASVKWQYVARGSPREEMRVRLDGLLLK